jgi:hypothetical protein
MTVAYDEAVIIESARRLYERAASIVVTRAVFGGGCGLLVVLLGGVWYDARSGLAHDLAIPSLVVAAIGAVLGYVVGDERAFELRLQAQTALCQVQIERHARQAATLATLVAMERGQVPPAPGVQVAPVGRVQQPPPIPPGG